MSAAQKKHFYHGWVIVIACMIVQAIPFGIAKNTISQFVPYVCEGEGFSLATFGTVFMVGVLISAFASPFIGKLFDNPKINKKLLYGIGAVLSGGGFALYSFCHSLGAFYGVSAIVEIGTAIISSIGVPVLINAWFKEKRGLALGIAFAGGGIGNIVLQQIAPRLLDSKGYGYTYLIMGLISMCIAVPIAFIFVRLPKSEAELEGETSGTTSVKKDSNANEAVKKWGYTFSELTKIPMFWVFALAWIFVGLYVAGMSVQYNAYFKALDFSVVTRANIGSLFAVCSIFGNLGGGTVFTKLGEKKSIVLAFGLVLACAVCLILAPQIPALGYVFGILLGLSVFSYIIGPSFLAGSLFGNKFYGTIVGVINIFFAFGYAIGSVLFGVVAKNGANYSGAWIYIAVCVVVAYVCLIIGTNYFMEHKGQKV